MSYRYRKLIRVVVNNCGIALSRNSGATKEKNRGTRWRIYEGRNMAIWGHIPPTGDQILYTIQYVYNYEYNMLMLY